VAALMIDAAIVGLGRWGKAIVEAVQGKSKRLRFIHSVSPQSERVADFVAAHGLEFSTEFAEVVAHPRVQAVVLATPHLLHVDQVIAVARAGKPVWCEKPLALTRCEAERAVAACREAGVILALGNSKRYFPSMRALTDTVASGVLGTILHVEGHFCNEHSTRVLGGWRDDPRQAPGAGMTSAGLHILDAFVNLAGPIAEVDARIFARKPPPDPRDSIAALIEFETGATGVLATVRAAPTYWRVQVFGTKGWAEARDEDTLTVAPVGQAPKTQSFAHVDSLLVLSNAFADAVERLAPFLVSPAQMLDLISAFEAVVASIETGAPTDVGRG
jgi:predicted dehydrogenase